MLNLERSRGVGRAGWLSLLGVLIVPLLVAGGFLLATWKSQDRLSTVRAAVVNLDEPVKIKGQLVPLGRQLSGGLVDGKDDDGNAGDRAKNFTWVLSDPADAADGLANGSYAAVVTIPKSFSADATSYSANDADKAEHATLEVQTSTITGVTDPAVAQAISSTAVSALNRQLTEEYLKNIYIGFNTTGKQFSTVADGAKDLSDGASGLSSGITQASTGTGKLADGLDKLSTGAGQLSSGIGQLDAGAGSAATGATKLAAGAAKLDTGTATFAAGTKQNADGAATYAKGARAYADGAGQAAAQVAQFDTGIQQSYQQLTKLTPAQLTQVCNQTQVSSQQCQAFQETFSQILAGIYEGTPAQNGQPANPGLLKAATGLKTGTAKLAGGADQLATGASALSTGAGKINKGAQQLSTGVHGLSTGAGQLSGGITKLSDGISKLDTGAGSLATGASQSSDGAAKLYQGTVKLDAGGQKLADGTKKLSDGLAKGAKQIPTYSSADRTTLSSVVAAPVSSERPDTLFSDQTTTTLLAALALWLGGLVTYLVLRAVSSGAVGSMKSSARLALEGLAPGLLVALVQAAVLSVTLWGLLDLSGAQLARLLALSTFAGVTFAVINFALVAWFGGIGRFVSVALLALSAAGALTTALPAFFGSIRPVLPVTPALDGLRSVVTNGPGTGHAVGVLLAWFVVGLAASVVAVARRRMLPAATVALA